MYEQHSVCQSQVILDEQSGKQANRKCRGNWPAWVVDPFKSCIEDKCPSTHVTASRKVQVSHLRVFQQVEIGQNIGVLYYLVSTGRMVELTNAICIGASSTAHYVHEQNPQSKSGDTQQAVLRGSTPYL